jgi:hypothetical protein
MGTNDRDRAANAKPQHPVTLSDYWIDRIEITNDQYRLCVDAGTCAPPSNREYFDLRVYGNFPVTDVTYEAAATYCLWVATQTGQVIGLPTEAQWEKAAGWDPVSETQREYPWGDAFPNPNLLRFNESPANRPAAPVGSYPDGASAYGVLDLAGNVWEWTADWFDETYYHRTGVSLDPTGPLSGSARVTRGGAWARPGYLAATFVRNPVRPTTNSNEIGFRCGMTASRPPAGSRIAMSPLDLIVELKAILGQPPAGSDSGVLDAWSTSLDALAEALTEIDRETVTALTTEGLERLNTQQENNQLAPSLALQLDRALRWIQEQAVAPAQ